MINLCEINRIKKQDIIKTKNLIFFCIVIVLSIFTLFTLAISKHSNSKDFIKIELNSNDKINEFIVSKNSLPLSKFENDNLILVSDDEEKKLNCLNKTELLYEISVIDNLYVNFENVSENTKFFLNDTQINFENNNFIENDDSKLINIERNKFVIIKEGIKNFGTLNIFFVSLISLIMWFIILKLFVINLNKIKEDKIGIINIFSISFITFLLYLNTIYSLMYINRFFVIVPVLILASVFMFIFNKSKKNWHNIFLCLSLLFGSVFIFVVPPGHVPDEFSHYVRTYADSEIFANKEEGVKLPVNVNNLFDKFVYNVHSNEAVFSGATYLTELHKPGDYSNLSDTSTKYENTKHLSFVPYLPATIINVIGKLFNIPILIVFLLARFSNFCISIILCYYAIKITPIFTKIFLLVGLFPIFFQQAAGVNMDYLTNSITFMLLALILRNKYDKSFLTNKDIVLLMLTALGIGMCKFGYFPLLGLVWIIPNNKFKNKNIAIAFKISIVILPIILSCLFNFVNVSSPNTKSDYYTIEKVLKNPIDSAIICLRTFIARFDLDTFRGLIDGFGWSTKYSRPLILWTMASIYIILLFISDDENKQVKVKDRIIMLLVFGMVYVILYGIAFTEWTKIEFNVIDGLQSRYFIPILILFYGSISNNFIKLNVKNKYDFYYILLNIVEASAVATLLVGFY